MQRVRLSPQDYVCIGCEVTVAEHETVFESRAGRLLRGAAVDAAYIPLSTPSGSSVPEGGDGGDSLEQRGASDMDTIRERAFAQQDYSSNTNVRIRPSPPRILSSQTKK